MVLELVRLLTKASGSIGVMQFDFIDKLVSDGEAVREIEDAFGIEVVERVGSGYYGKVFRLEDDSIAKYTVSKEEIWCAEFVVKHNLAARNPHIPRIYDLVVAADESYALIRREELDDLRWADLHYDWPDDLDRLPEPILEELMDEVEVDSYEDLILLPAAARNVLSEYFMHYVLWPETHRLEEDGLRLYDAGKIENWGKRWNEDGSFDIVFRDLGCALSEQSSEEEST